MPVERHPVATLEAVVISYTITEIIPADDDICVVLKKSFNAPMGWEAEPESSPPRKTTQKSSLEGSTSTHKSRKNSGGEGDNSTSTHKARKYADADTSKNRRMSREVRKGSSGKLVKDEEGKNEVSSTRKCSTKDDISTSRRARSRSLQKLRSRSEECNTCKYRRSSSKDKPSPEEDRFEKIKSPRQGRRKTVEEKVERQSSETEQP